MLLTHFLIKLKPEVGPSLAKKIVCYIMVYVLSYIWSRQGTAPELKNTKILPEIFYKKVVGNYNKNINNISVSNLQAAIKKVGSICLAALYATHVHSLEEDLLMTF